MAVDLGTLTARLGLDASGFKAGVTQANQGMRALSNAASLLKGALAGAGVVAFFKTAIKASAEAEQTFESMRATFGDASAEMEAWADRTGAALGRQSDTMAGLATSARNVADSFVKNKTVATEMSKQLAEVAVQIERVRGIPADEALRKLEAGLSGASRAVRDLGIDISEERLQEEAYRNGLNANVADLDEAQKAVLRYQISMQALQPIQERAATGTLTLSETWRRTVESAKDLAQTIGDKLRPALQTILSVVNDIIDGFKLLVSAGDLIDALQGKQPRFGISAAGVSLGGGRGGGGQPSAVKAADDFSASLRKTIDEMERERRARAATAKAIEEEAAKRKGMAEFFQKGLLSFGAAAELGKQLQEETKELIKNIEVDIRAKPRTGRAMVSVGGEPTKVKELNDMIARAGEEHRAKAQAVAKAFSDGIISLEEAKASLNEFAGAVVQFGAAAAQFGKNILATSPEISAIVQGFAAGGPFGAVFAAIFEIVKKMENFGTIIGQISEGFQMLSNALNPILDPLVKINEMINAVIEGLAPLIEAFANFIAVLHGPLVEVSRFASLAILQIVKWIADAWNSIVGVIQDVVSSVTLGVQKINLKFDTAGIEKAMRKLQGLDKIGNAVDAATKAEAKSTAATKEKTRITKEATQSLVEMTESLSNVPTGFKVALIRFRATLAEGAANFFGIGGVSGVPQHFARGGIVTGPTLAMIGEGGPEAVVPLDGARGLGEVYIENFIVQGSRDPRATAREVLEALRREAFLRTGASVPTAPYLLGG